MTNLRTIKITCDESFDKVVNLTRHHVLNGINYLSTWALGSDRYLNVDLRIKKDGDIDAVYFDKDGLTTYVMGGIWHDDENRYSFHS